MSGLFYNRIDIELKNVALTTKCVALAFGSSSSAGAALLLGTLITVYSILYWYLYTCASVCVCVLTQLNRRA